MQKRVVNGRLNSHVGSCFNLQVPARGVCVHIAFQSALNIARACVVPVFVALILGAYALLAWALAK